MIWLLAVIGAIVSSELIFRLPILPQVRTMTGATAKAARTIRSARISDHWKERALPAFAGRLMFSSVAFFGLLVIAVTPTILLGVFVDGGIPAWLGQLVRPAVLGVLIGVSVLYILLRKKVTSV